MIISALLAGIIFGIGLALAGMLNPTKVIGFLDVFGTWDPSLAFVLAGGIAINSFGHYLLIKKKSRPLFVDKFQMPSSIKIDKHLIIGSAIFGIGWGLAGLCPGPVVASLVINTPDMLLFFLLMLVGLKIGSMIKARN